MNELRDVSLVFGAFDEEQRLPALLRHLSDGAEAELADCGLRFREAVIVDDGSTDATLELLRAAAASDPRINPVHSWQQNRGKGAAIKAGIEAAAHPLVLLADVDLSTPLADAEGLVEAMAGGADVVIGSRDLEASRVDAPGYRKALGFGFNRLVRGLTGLSLTDTQAGFKLIDTETARALVADQLSSGFAYDVELLMRAQRSGLKIAEVPVSYVHDHGSKVRVLGSGFDMATDLLRLAVALRARGERRP